MEHRGKHSGAVAPDLEHGHYSHDYVETHYVKDFTYRIIPLCVAILVFFSDGAILVCTLAFDQPIPRQGVVVVSILLAVFFFLFCIGGLCAYRQKRFPPRLRTGPNRFKSSPPTWKSGRLGKWARSMKRTKRRFTNYMDCKPTSGGTMNSQSNSFVRSSQLRTDPLGPDRLTTKHASISEYKAARDAEVRAIATTTAGANSQQAQGTRHNEHSPQYIALHREEHRNDNQNRAQSGAQTHPLRETPTRQDPSRATPRNHLPVDGAGAYQRRPPPEQQQQQQQPRSYGGFSNPNNQVQSRISIASPGSPFIDGHRRSEASPRLPPPQHRRGGNPRQSCDDNVNDFLRRKPVNGRGDQPPPALHGMVTDTCCRPQMDLNSGGGGGGGGVGANMPRVNLVLVPELREYVDPDVLAPIESKLGISFVGIQSYSDMAPVAVTPTDRAGYDQGPPIYFPSKVAYLNHQGHDRHTAATNEKKPASSSPLPSKHVQNPAHNAASENDSHPTKATPTVGKAKKARQLNKGSGKGYNHQKNANASSTSSSNSNNDDDDAALEARVRALVKEHISELTLHPQPRPQPQPQDKVPIVSAQAPNPKQPIIQFPSAPSHPLPSLISPQPPSPPPSSPPSLPADENIDPKLMAAAPPPKTDKEKGREQQQHERRKRRQRQQQQQRDASTSTSTSAGTSTTTTSRGTSTAAAAAGAGAAQRLSTIKFSPGTEAERATTTSTPPRPLAERRYLPNDLPPPPPPQGNGRSWRQQQQWRRGGGGSSSSGSEGFI